MKDLDGSASSPLTHERRLAIYDKVFVALQDAKKHVRDDLVSRGFRNFSLSGVLLIAFLRCFCPAKDDSVHSMQRIKGRRAYRGFRFLIPSPFLLCCFCLPRKHPVQLSTLHEEEGMKVLACGGPPVRLLYAGLLLRLERSFLRILCSTKKQQLRVVCLVNRILALSLFELPPAQELNESTVDSIIALSLLPQFELACAREPLFWQLFWMNCTIDGDSTHCILQPSC
jgi:hypothetical protein